MKKKIVFVMPSLEGGGAERVTVNLINRIDQVKFESVLILGKNEGKLKETLRPGIKTYDLKVNKMSKGVLGIIKILLREKPDIVFSVMGYVNLLCMMINVALGNRFKMVLTEHTTVSKEFQRNPNIMMKVQKHLKRILYPKADRIVCVSKGAKDDLESFLSVKLDNATVIYNPILDDDYWDGIEEANHPWFTKENFVLITAGRLVPEKGFNYLIEALNELVNIRKERNIKLLILGEGPERSIIQSLINRYYLGSHVQLMGFQNNIRGYFAKSDVFVLSSLFEGLPTVLIEAMGLKLPVISTRCPSGPEEIIMNEKQGVLVPVAEARSLAEAVLELKNDRTYLKTLKEEGFLRSLDFKSKIAIDKYEGLFEKTGSN